jgi:hypothetical protein
MQWGALVEQAVGLGLFELAIIVLLIGIAIGLAVALMWRRR